MRRQSLILGIVLVVLVLAFYLYNYSDLEGFQTTEDMIQVRFNPMAGGQNPLANPAAAIGISRQNSATLTSMTETALNIPTATPDGIGSYTQETPDNTITPRIDDVDTYLGLIKMCKEKGKGDTPFNDGEFNENCGMCITSGTLKTGESFTGPTGVLVYKEDKDRAIARAARKGHPFARAIPSVDSAICLGANQDNDSLPVLAINQKDYSAFKKRHDCRTSKKIGDQCGRCITDNESTWVPPSGGKQPLTLYLWGSGKAKVTLASGFTSQLISLSGSATPVPIGRVEEGTGFQISVDSDQGPYVYGAIISPTAARGFYKLPIEKFMELDTISGSAPRRDEIKYFDDVKVFCTKLMAQSNKTKMNLTGFIPITLVEKDQLAAFDCPSDPIVQKQASAELLIDDDCLNPRGQGPGTYSEDCIKQTILEGGCSTNGTWYQNPESQNVSNLGEYLKYIKAQALLVKKDPAAAMGCKGVDIRTPCDDFLNGGIPNSACMSYLYLNQSENNERVGRAYKNADTKNTSIINRTIAFCRPDGALNPGNPNGMATLVEKARGYRGLSGIEAVKTYLSEVFTKAFSSLDINVDDDKGGRKTSWKNCIDMNIAAPPLATVSLNSVNDVINNTQNCFRFPQNIDLPRQKGKMIGQVSLTQDYTLSFNITPRSIYGNWNNIIHFTTTNLDWNTFGFRCPAIWFHPGDLRLHVRIGDTTDFNWGVDTTESIPINQKSSFRLQCTGKEVTITVNDKVYRATQPTTRPTGDALVYAPNPWHMSANAYVQNLCYVGGNSPVTSPSNYTCMKGFDNLGSEIGCWYGMTRQQAEDRCNNDPSCGSYNTYVEGGGIGACTKRTVGTVVNNKNPNVTNYCFKNT